MNKKAIIVSIFFCAMCVASLWTNRSKPVVFSCRESGDLMARNRFVLFNPFRDRGPEEAGEIFLNYLQSGDYAVLLGSFQEMSDDWASDFAEKESDYRIAGWKLVDRADLSDGVRLSYWAVRTYGTESAESPVWLTVKKTTSGRTWTVTGYEAWY